MKICFILATRPEIIKAYPLIKIFEKKKLKAFLLKQTAPNLAQALQAMSLKPDPGNRFETPLIRWPYPVEPMVRMKMPGTT